jgi:hypothetical protein
MFLQILQAPALLGGERGQAGVNTARGQPHRTGRPHSVGPARSGCGLGVWRVVVRGLVRWR